MPIYQCKCPGCQHEFEEFAKMAEADRISCPQCSTIATRVPCLPHRERHFVRQTAVSMMHGCRPEQVAEMRRRFPMVQWRDDGSVVYEKRSDETRYRKAKLKHIRQLHARVREHNERFEERKRKGDIEPPT